MTFLDGSKSQADDSAVDYVSQLFDTLLEDQPLSPGAVRPSTISISDHQRDSCGIIMHGSNNDEANKRKMSCDDEIVQVPTQQANKRRVTMTPPDAIDESSRENNRTSNVDDAPLRRRHTSAARLERSKSVRQEQYISRLFYEEEANDAKPTGRTIDLYSLSILKKLFIKLTVEEMFQQYSRRQFQSHMTSSLILMAAYKLVVVIVCAIALPEGSPLRRPESQGEETDNYLFGKILSAGIMCATSAVLLIGVHIESIYRNWPGHLSIFFLVIYGIDCLAEPWIEAGFYHSMFDPAPMVLHFLFTAYAMLPIGTLTSLIASALLSCLSIANQICIFIYAYEVIRKDKEEPEEGVVNLVISLCLLYLAANVIGIYLKVFCTELTYRQTFYNTRQFIETELTLSIESEVNNKIKEQLIHQILPPYLVFDILHQIETMKHFQIRGGDHRKRRNFNVNHFEKLNNNRSTIAMLGTMPEAKPSQCSDLSVLSDTKLLKLNIQKHTNVTILFADIVRFVQLTATLTPSELVETLHELYSRFDHLAGRFNCQRTKLIGDCYKCVAGLNSDTGEMSAENVVWMGLHMVEEISKVAQLKKVPQLKMRIGVHSGFVFAGILGLKKWQFDVWSQDVEIANALETEGRPNMVHASQATVDKLPAGYFNFEFVREFPNPVGRARDLLTRNSIRSYIVTCNGPIVPHLRSRPTSKTLLSIPPLPARADSVLSSISAVLNGSIHQGNNEQGGSVTLRSWAHKAKKVFGGVFPGIHPTNDHPETLLTEMTSDNPIGNSILDARQFYRQRQISPELKEHTINTRLYEVFFPPKNKEDATRETRAVDDAANDRISLEDFLSKMNPIAMTFKDVRLERVYKQHRDDPFQLAIVVSYLTFLIITAIIRLNSLEGANQAVTTAISSVTTLLLGLAVFFFTICGFSSKLMIRLRAFLRSNFARSVAYVSAMAVLYCNAFMPFYLCKALNEDELQKILGEDQVCNRCDLSERICNKSRNMSRMLLRRQYPPILNFEIAMSEPRTEEPEAGYCADAYLFGDITVLLIFVTAIFSRIPFLIRYLVIIIGNLVFVFFAFLLKPTAFSAYDLCAVQHMFYVTDLESKIYYTIFTFFFFLNLFVMCYQQEKNNRLDFLLRDGAWKKEQELKKKLAQNSALLENILPSHVIEWYLSPDSNTQELYIRPHDRVCVLFAKITNYTVEGESVEVMRALNEITAAFDNLLDRPEYAGVVEKIKINQAMFMYAAGLSTGMDLFEVAALKLIDFAAAMFDILSKVNDQISYPYKLRCGVHCGPVVAGVIGSSMPLYDILGNTVNIASRLETSGGSDGFIYVSQELTGVYDQLGLFYDNRISVEIRGLLGLQSIYVFTPTTVSDFMKSAREIFNRL